jgi:hypothetical protein
LIQDLVWPQAAHADGTIVVSSRKQLALLVYLSVEQAIQIGEADPLSPSRHRRS